MSEVLALSAALWFSFSHILIRRGLAHTDPVTGSVVSVALSLVMLWGLAALFLQPSSFLTPVVWYFAASGIFAPGIGRLLVYLGISRIGVARSVPLSSSSPLFSSLLAVVLIGEEWPLQNIVGTVLVVTGVIVISRTRTEATPWRRRDIVFPLLAALAFATASNLRKLGFEVENVPLMASTVNATTGFLFVMGMGVWQKGGAIARFSRRAFVWFVGAGVFNTLGLLFNLHALSSGKLVVVEPLLATAPVLTVFLTAIFLRDLEVVSARVVVGAACTVAGTILLVLL